MAHIFQTMNCKAYHWHTYSIGHKKNSNISSNSRVILVRFAKQILWQTFFCRKKNELFWPRIYWAIGGSKKLFSNKIFFSVEKNSNNGSRTCANINVNIIMWKNIFKVSQNIKYNFYDLESCIVPPNKGG